MDFPRDKVDYFVVEKIRLLKPYSRGKAIRKSCYFYKYGVIWGI